MTVTIAHQARLRRIVKKEVVRILLREQGTPADQARQMGLVKAPGFGNYADPNSGDVTHQSRGGQLVPTKQGQASGASGITEPPEQDPVAGEPGTTPSTAQRPPSADIPQNQPPADGEPEQPAQRGGPSVGGTPEMPQGPEMPENPLTKLMRKIVDPDKIKMAAATGDTDSIKTTIDQLAIAKDKISQSREGRAGVATLDKLMQGVQQQFGNAMKQKQALGSFGETGETGGEEEENVFDPAADQDTRDSNPKQPDQMRSRRARPKAKSKKPGSAYGDWNRAIPGGPSH